MALDHALNNSWADEDVSQIRRNEEHGGCQWEMWLRGTLPPGPAAIRSLSSETTGMTRPLRVLCVHGVGHHEADPASDRTWRDAIHSSLHLAHAGCVPEVQFVKYDELFANRAIRPQDIAEALLKLGASGVIHGVGDLVSGLFGRRRGLGDVGDSVRWTAGMVVQWAEDDTLRKLARKQVVKHVNSFDPHLILSHSLGSLISYDAFARPANSSLIQNRIFVSLGSQIGNPFVRSSVAFNGRIEAIPTARHWFHLYNRHDNAFTARLRVGAGNFSQTDTHFNDPGLLDHDAARYLTHPNAVDSVWREVARLTARRQRASGAPRTTAKMEAAFAIAEAKPERRALLVGINDYPNPANRLEGCVNDVFLMSSVLQDCGFDAENIRVVLNERATAGGIRERLEWLLDGSKDGQDRVFYYSGHGAQIPGYGVGEVVDHDDECLVSYDFDWSRDHCVTDDQFYELYSQLPYGTRFLTIFDCCHSGGLSRNGALKARGINPPDDIRHRLLRWNPKEGMWEQRKTKENAPKLSAKSRTQFFGKSGITSRLGCASGLRLNMTKGSKQACKDMGHQGPYMPVILKACQEQEYAYEYRHGVVSYGAFTYSLAQVFRQRRRAPSWTALLGAVADKLDSLNYDQHPAVDGPSDVLKKPVPWRR